MRTGNESVFSNIVQTDLTLIDFDDLGEIIYKHKLGFNRPQNLADSLVSITTIEELDKLKADLDSNYNRFFKENFKDKEFDKKWKQLFKVRNKVAHNNLFVLKDLETTVSLHKELKEIILTAESKIDDFKFSVEEQVAIRETISEKDKKNPIIVTIRLKFLVAHWIVQLSENEKGIKCFDPLGGVRSYSFKQINDVAMSHCIVFEKL